MMKLVQHQKQGDNVRFLFFINSQSREAEAVRDSLAEELVRRGQTLCGEDMAEQADVIVVLGGDGTVLRAVHRWQALHKPFWAVNCGHLGYLSDCGPEQAAEGIRRILEGEYRLEERCVLDGTLQGTHRMRALNELIFHRGECAHGLYIEARVNGSLAMRYRGDGLVVCTPSGSTAYNLSAGGPLLMPEMDLLCLTPICAQALSAAPIVASARDEICISWRMNDCEGAHPCVTADALEKMTLENAGEAVLHAMSERVSLLRTQCGHFCERLQQRMRWNV